MIDIGTVIFQQIDQAHDFNTFQGNAPRQIYNDQMELIDTPFPYVVFKLMTVDSTENDRDDFMLEVSCWDKSYGTSHVRAMALAEDVRKALVRYMYVDENIYMAMSRPNVGFIPDEDEQIKRYDVTSMIRTYRRENA